MTPLGIVELSGQQPVTIDASEREPLKLTALDTALHAQGHLANGVRVREALFVDRPMTFTHPITVTTGDGDAGRVLVETP
jgi:hypothetical protein